MQNKFVKQDTVLIATIKKAIETEIKRRNSSFIHEVIYTKHLTECPRRLMYRMNAYSAKEPDFLIDNHNKYTKKKWVDFFNKCKKTIVIDENVLAADCNFNVVGTADAILKYGDVVSVLLVDSVKSSEYNKAKQAGGLRRQIVELMMIMWLTEVPNGILICENKDTNEYFLSHVVPHKGILDSARHKCSELMENQFLQKLPERAYKTDNSQECMACEYRETCWNQEEKTHG